MGQDEFSTLVDRTGLVLSGEQKAVLFAAYPLFREMVARATPAMPRESEPAVMFVPEVR